MLILIVVVTAALMLVATACSGGGDAAEDFGGEQPEQDGNRGDRSILPAATQVPQFGSGDAGSLVMGFAASSDHPIVARALIPFANQVNEATGGSVAFEVFPDAQIVQNPDTFQNVVVGGQDIGWGVHSLTAGRFPATSVIELPYAFDNAVGATDALWTLHDEFVELQNEYLDVKILGLWAQDPGIIWSTAGPISTADDLSPLAIGVPGPIQNDLIAALDSIPAPLLPSEVPGAFTADEIGGVLMSSTMMSVNDLGSVIDGGLDCRCFVGAEFLVMNIQAWDELSPDQQAAIEQFSGRQFSMQVAQIYDEERQAFASALGEQGVTVTSIDVGSSRWRGAADSVVDNWIGAGADTRLPTQAMHDRLVALSGS